MEIVKNYEQEYADLMDWFKIKTEEYEKASYEELLKGTSCGYDGSPVERTHQQVTKEYRHKLKEIKEKYNVGLDLNPVIQRVLTKINFVKRYEQLSKDSEKGVSRGQAKDIGVEVIAKMINNLGYETTYYKGERFLVFKTGIAEKAPLYKIWFNIVLRSRAVRFVWTVYHNDEMVLGDPGGVQALSLDFADKKVYVPIYSTATELEQILKVGFEMYEGFKAELIEEYNG